LRDSLSNFDQDLVTVVMPEEVVEALQVVDVSEDHADAFGGRVLAVTQIRNHLLETPPIELTRELVNSFGQVNIGH
jgi:hypothetical protein